MIRMGILGEKVSELKIRVEEIASDLKEIKDEIRFSSGYEHQLLQENTQAK